MRRDTATVRPIGFQPAEISVRVNQMVVDQHAADAAFLWTQRDHAVTAPQYSLTDLAALDERVEANIDGLRTANDAGWETSVQSIELGPGEVFAAGLLAFDGTDAGRLARVLEAGAADPAAAGALISALGWMPPEAGAAVAKDLVQSADPEIRRLGIGGLAVHRIDPGADLISSISSSDSRLRARTLKAIAELGRTDLLGAVVLQLEDPDDDCRFTAAWSAARLGAVDRNVLDSLRAFSRGAGDHSHRATDMALRCMRGPAARAWIQELVDSEATARLGAIGIGVVGDPAFIEPLLALLNEPPVARVAGEAFATITGLDLGYEDLDADAPEGGSEPPDDEEVAVDLDEDLQWPAADSIAQWWMHHSDRFQPGIRYLAGEPISEDSLRRTLVTGTQRQRHAAALEIALRHPSQVLFETRERGDRQMRKVKQWIS
jgi:uncharacterized protein (TIGR02270 family)